MGAPLIDLPVQWTPWRPLNGSTRDKGFPEQPGLYRIRREGQDHLDYVGQTGRTLRKRLADLGRLDGPKMPFRDPHTAGPGLWALLHGGGPALEVSVTAVDGDEPFRKAVEAAVISQHRERYGFSPTINFGRMPVGYVMSTERKRGLRGGLSAEPASCHQPGVPTGVPLAPMGEQGWGGHSWSGWVPLSEARGLAPKKASGLYLIRDGEQLLYVGQGALQTRLTAHAQKSADHVQGRFFQGPGVDARWVTLPEHTSNQLQELENDLIAAWFLATGAPPKAQFLGNRSG